MACHFKWGIFVFSQVLYSKDPNTIISNRYGHNRFQSRASFDSSVVEKRMEKRMEKRHPRPSCPRRLGVFRSRLPAASPAVPVVRSGLQSVWAMVWAMVWAPDAVLARLVAAVAAPLWGMSLESRGIELDSNGHWTSTVQGLRPQCRRVDVTVRQQ